MAQGRFFHEPEQLIQADMGMDGTDNLQAGETLQVNKGSRVTSDGNTRVTSTGATRGVDATDVFRCWIKVEPAVKTGTVVLDTGCEVLTGEAPPEDASAIAGAPIRATFTKIVTKAANDDAIAYRLHN